jgi:HAD superfamily hydrolase (TIGR01549 family)
MKTKLILFDWGNIVESHTTGYSCHDAWDDLFRECGFESDKRVFSLLGKYRLSCIRNSEEFEKVFNQLKEDFHFNKTYDEFVEIYKRVFSKIDSYQDVADYEKSLKDKCYIGILSDLTPFDKERLDKQVDLSQYDYVFLSFELGMKKPDMEIYEAVQKQLPFEPQNILFIDDREDNIESASKMGWNTLQATGLELNKIKRKCEEFLGEK